MPRNLRRLILLAMAPAAVAFVAQTAAAQIRDPAVERGRAVFKRCYACHTAYGNERAEHGLSLWRVIGRRAGSVRGFDYSPAMRAKGRDGFVWSEVELDRFMADPGAAVPGTSMPAPGMSDARERADLIAFLRRAERTAPPASGRR